MEEEEATLSLIGRRVEMLEHQNTTLLILSAINLFMNIATVGVALVAAWP